MTVGRALPRNLAHQFYVRKFEDSVACFDCIARALEVAGLVEGEEQAIALQDSTSYRDGNIISKMA
jgi:hypothetical protein